MIENGLYVDAPVTRHSSIFSISAVVGSATQCAPASAKRKRITFTSQGANSVILSTVNPIDATREVFLSTSGGPLIMDFNDYGTLIQSAWFAQALVGTNAVGVIDTVEQ